MYLYIFKYAACILHRIIFVLRIRNSDYQWIQHLIEPKQLMEEMNIYYFVVC